MASKERFLAFSLFCLFSLFFLALGTFALGISPGSLSFQDVASGGFASSQMLVSTSSEQDEIIGLFIDDEFASWISFLPNQTSIVVKRGQPKLIEVQIHPPADVPEGSYKATIRFSTLSLSPGTQQFGVFVVKEILAPIEIQVTNERKTACSAGGLKIYDTEASSAMLIDFQLVNQGNVRVKPTISINIFDSSGKLAFQHEETAKKDILPTTKEKVQLYFPHSLDEGDFLAIVSMNACDFRESIPFTVEPKGTFVEQGNILNLEHKPFAYPSEQIPIEAEFRNEGITPVFAQLEIEAKKEGKLAEFLLSDKVLVNAKDQEKLVVYLSPKDPGKYTLGARVLYGMVSEKETFTSASVLNIVGEEKESINFFPYVVMVLMVVVIVVLILKIRKRSD